MDEPSSTTPPSSAPGSTGTSVVAWFAVCVLVSAGLSLVAAHAPGRVRLLGLFSIVFGAVIGWSIVWLAQKLDARPKRTSIGLLAAVLTLGGLIGCLWETIRVEEVMHPKSANEQLAERLYQQMQNNDGKSMPREQSPLDNYRSYLARRVRQLGDWKSPWPETLWLVELFAACAASIWVSNSFYANADSIATTSDSVKQ